MHNIHTLALAISIAYIKQVATATTTKSYQIRKKAIPMSAILYYFRANIKFVLKGFKSVSIFCIRIGRAEMVLYILIFLSEHFPFPRHFQLLYVATICLQFFSI